MTTTNKLKALALGLLSLASVSTYAAPPPAAVGTPAYQAWKASQEPAASLSGNAITTSVNNPSNATAPGCYFAPDASYTSCPGMDDESVGPISIPFGFNFYGTTYTSCYINNNGNITFGSDFYEYYPAGFPSGTLPEMIAPFWADFDTYSGATIKYKVEAHRIIVTWPGVRRYGGFSNILLNTFQCILTDGTDPSIGIGNNVAFYYGDMQWATSGYTGFGGSFPATVGINRGNGTDFIQVGRFNQSGSAYDGSGGNPDGVDYLDYECFTYNVAVTANVPTISQWGLMILCLLSLTIGMIFIYKREKTIAVN